MVYRKVVLLLIVATSHNAIYNEDGGCYVTLSSALYDFLHFIVLINVTPVKV